MIKVHPRQLGEFMPLSYKSQNSFFDIGNSTRIKKMTQVTFRVRNKNPFTNLGIEFENIFVTFRCQKGHVFGPIISKIR